MENLSEAERVWDKEDKAVWPDPFQILSEVKFTIQSETTGRVAQTLPSGGRSEHFRCADRPTLMDFYCVTSAPEVWLSTIYHLQTLAPNQSWSAKSLN